MINKLFFQNIMSSIFQLSNDDDSKTNNNDKSEISDNDNNEGFRIIMSFDDIENTIPKDSIDYPQLFYQLFYTENRWRYFNINNQIYIEISQKEPYKERMFLSQNGDWTEYKIDPNMDKFIIKQKFYYS